MSIIYKCFPPLIQMLDEFLLIHPTLEFLRLDFYSVSYYVPLISDTAMSLSKLRVLVYDIQSTQNHRRSLLTYFKFLILNVISLIFCIDVVEALANYCPNLEVLKLNYRTVKGGQRLDVGFLSLLRFPKITTLILRGHVQMNDGAFLVQVIVIWYIH